MPDFELWTSLTAYDLVDAMRGLTGPTVVEWRKDPNGEDVVVAWPVARERPTDEEVRERWEEEVAAEASEDDTDE